jgi:hypothetical protein
MSRLVEAVVAASLLACSNSPSGQDAGTDGGSADAASDVLYCVTVDAGCFTHDDCGNAFALSPDGAPTTVCGRVCTCAPLDDAGDFKISCEMGTCSCNACTTPP